MIIIMVIIIMIIIVVVVIKEKELFNQCSFTMQVLLQQRTKILTLFNFLFVTFVYLKITDLFCFVDEWN